MHFYIKIGWKLHQKGLLAGQGTRSLQQQPRGGGGGGQGEEGRCASFIVQYKVAAPTSGSNVCCLKAFSSNNVVLSD